MCLHDEIMFLRSQEDNDNKHTISYLRQQKMRETFEDVINRHRH